MCSGTGLLMATFSDGCLQMLLAVMVQTTSLPGTTFCTGTSCLVFSPLASTTSCSTSAVDLSAMQPAAGACAKACEPKLQARMAMTPMCLRTPSIMSVSLTGWFPLVDGHGEIDGLRAAGLREIAERHVHMVVRIGVEIAGVGVDTVGECRTVEL